MITPENVVNWFTEIDHDLHEENGHIFGVTLNLYKGYNDYYEKTLNEDGRESLLYLSQNIFEAVDKFNAILENGETYE